MDIIQRLLSKRAISIPLAILVVAGLVLYMHGNLSPNRQHTTAFSPAHLLPLQPIPSQSAVKGKIEGAYAGNLLADNSGGNAVICTNTSIILSVDVNKASILLNIGIPSNQDATYVFGGQKINGGNPEEVELFPNGSDTIPFWVNQSGRIVVSNSGHSGQMSALLAPYLLDNINTQSVLVSASWNC